MTYKVGPRPFACLGPEANGNRSREGGFVDPAHAAEVTPNMLVAEGPAGLVPYDGVLPVRGVFLVYPNELGRVSYAARDAEIKGWTLVRRTSGPRAVTGGKVAAVPAAGKLTLNGVDVAIPAAGHLSAIAAAITASGAGVTAKVRDGLCLRLVADAGGPLTIAGDAAVLAELGLAAGAVGLPTAAQIEADDNAELAALDLRVR